VSTEQVATSAGTSGLSDSADRKGRYGRRALLSLNTADVAVAALLALAMFGASWYRHATFRSTAYDLGVFDQAIWLMAHGKAPISTLIGRNIFADHLSPVLVLFVPLYWIAATPLWLLAAQALALGIGFLALQALLQQVGVDRPWRLTFSFAYVVSTLLWQGALYDFHSSTLAVPFIFIGLTATLRDDRQPLAWSSLAILLIRDDLGLVVISLALIGFRGSEHRAMRMVLIAISAAWVLIGQAIGIVVGSPYLWHIYYGRLGPNGRWVLTHPWLSIPRALRGLLRGDVLKDVVIWLLPLAFLPLLRPGRLLLGSLWAVPLLIASPVLGPGGLYLYHFGAILLPFFVLAAAEAATRFGPKAAQLGRAMVVTFASICFVALSPFKTWIGDRGHHPGRLDEKAIGLIPAQAAVTASLGLGPHLAHRATLLPFPYPFAAQRRLPTSPENVRIVSEAAASKIEWIAIDERDSSAATLQAFFASPYLKGFDLVFHQDGVYVFRRTGPHS
jgi:uncharacterized membrane protein